MGTRMEQPGEFLPRAGRASSSQPEGLADSLYRLSSAAEDLQVIISCCNRALLLQGEFCITLKNSLYWKTAEQLLLFREPAEFCLGVSAKTPFGAGAGEGLQKDMLESISVALVR